MDSKKLLALKRLDVVDSILRDKTLSRDFCDFFLGEYLGSGVSRHVFRSKANQKRVIKIAYDSPRENIIEDEVWTRIQFVKKYNKWFSPVHSISPSGYVLEMSYARTIPSLNYPDKIPAFFTDVNRSNFGWLNGHVVCLDYAANLLMEKGMDCGNRKVEWF